MRRGFFCFSALTVFAVMFQITAFQSALFAQDVIKSNSFALRGEAKYKTGFTHFDYVNPDAPKGGQLRLAAIAGTYDNFNRYAMRGYCTEGWTYFYDDLMAPSGDEVDVLYPLIAESIEYADDYSYIIFNINPAARDHEGQPITAEDVAFSFNTFYEKGVPQFRSYYKGIRATAVSKTKARFDMPPELDDNGKPQLDSNGRQVYSRQKIFDLASNTVLPKRFWSEHDFSDPLIIPPLGTGPYRVKDYRMGQYVILERVKDYWAAELPVNKGRYNFDTIRYDYYSDNNVKFEAFKSGEIDFRQETSPKNWATQYTGKLFDSGVIVREEIPNEIAQPMRALIFNIQRPIFSDRRIRIALNYFFDFEWMNKNLFYNTYVRTRSYFENTIYEAHGVPDADELKELGAVKDKVPLEVFTTEFNPPVTDGTGDIRNQAREAMAIFAEAGWVLKNGKLVNGAGEQFSFELLIYDVDTESIAVSYQRNLARYGIDMQIRSLDTTQFINRVRIHDFDMIAFGYVAEQAPGAGLMIVWNSKFIDSTWNLANVIDPAIDYLTEQIAAEATEKRLLTLGRVLDRVLTWNYFVVPEWNLPKFRIAYKNFLRRPKIMPKYALDIDAWWVEPGNR